MPGFDMHTHSTRSDGTLSPREVVELAAERGLDGVALTDHDTTDGLAEAARSAEESGIAFVPGIALASVLGLPAWLVLAWLRDLDFPPLVRLVETAAFAFAGGVLVCWIMPSIFLGHEAAVLARSVIAIWASRTRARPVAGA